MLSYLQEHRFKFLTFCVAVGFWFLESLLHMHLFDKTGFFVLIPQQPNELWMRIVICLLIVVIGYVADRHIKTLHKIQKEKLRTLKATMYNVHDVAGNALNQISLSYEDDENINQIISETIKKLNEISNVDEVVEEKNSQGIRNIRVTQSHDEDQMT